MVVWSEGWHRRIEFFLGLVGLQESAWCCRWLSCWHGDWLVGIPCDIGIDGLRCAGRRCGCIARSGLLIGAFACSRRRLPAGLAAWPGLVSFLGQLPRRIFMGAGGLPILEVLPWRYKHRGPAKGSRQPCCFPA